MPNSKKKSGRNTNVGDKKGPSVTGQAVDPDYDEMPELTMEDVYTEKPILIELLQNKVIRQSRSPWSANSCLIKERGSESHRYVCDYRGLNAATQRSNFPVPTVAEVLKIIEDHMENAQFFTVLEFKSAFWQIPLAESSKHKTAFTPFMGPRLQCEWNRMPYGLCESIVTLQKVMYKMFQGLINNCIVVYYDQIIVFSKCFDSHMARLDQVFKALEKGGMKLDSSRCQFATQNAKFAGHLITPLGVRPDPVKLAVIREYLPPKNAMELRRFLGYVSYYTRYASDYKSLAAVLIPLTKPNAKWVWNATTQDAFDELRTALDWTLLD